MLEKISDEVLNAVLAQQPAALGYAMRWKKYQAAYLAWANEREASGWRFSDGEQERKVTLDLSDTQLTLIGRIDRVDRHEDGRVAVLDYKTSDKAALKKRLAGVEDHQLAFYGLLLSPTPAEAAYVAIDTDKPEYLVAEPYDDWREKLVERVQKDLDAIHQGEPLPAVGNSASCRYCDARGLCRKGTW